MIAKAEKRAIPPTPAEPNGGSLIRNEKLQQLYATMLQCRMLEERARLLAAQTRLTAGSMAACGHEAAEVGCTVDLHKEDVVASARHTAIGNFLRGISLPCTLSKLYELPANTRDIQVLRRPSARAAGKGSDAPGNARTQFDASVELACRFKKTGNVVVAFSAPGAFSDGMWREALIAAGAESLPIIFVRRDKLSAETGNAGARSAESRSARLASKSDTASLRDQDYGFPRIPVDGHDVVAVYRVAHESIQRARRGGGPTLIECQPYFPVAVERNRIGRPGNLRAEMDPIRHMELYLNCKGLFRDSWKNRLIEEFSRRLDAAFDGAKRSGNRPLRPRQRRDQ